MLVQITQAQTIQDVGIERQFGVGDRVDVSSVVGAALVRRGVARVIALAETRERAVVAPPETGHRRGRR